MDKTSGPPCGIRKRRDIEVLWRFHLRAGGVSSTLFAWAFRVVFASSRWGCRYRRKKRDSRIAWNGGSIFTYYYTIVYYAAGITRSQDQFMIAAIQNATWCIGGVVGGYMLDIWGRRTNYLIGTGQACLLLIIQGAITIAIFDKGQENLPAGAAFVAFYLLQWFLWVTFFSPGKSLCSMSA